MSHLPQDASHESWRNLAEQRGLRMRRAEGVAQTLAPTGVGAHAPTDERALCTGCNESGKLVQKSVGLTMGQPYWLYEVVVRVRCCNSGILRM